MAKRNEEGLVLNTQAKKALDGMLKQLMVFVYTVKNDQNIQKLNKELSDHLEKVTKMAEEVRAKAQNNQPITPEELMQLSHELNRTKDMVHAQKFESTVTRMLKNMGAVTPLAKRMDQMPEQKQMDEMQKVIGKSLEQIQAYAEMLRKNAQPRHLSSVQKLTKSVTDFSSTVKDKIMSIFRKKKVVVPEKVKSYGEGLIDEARADPAKAQFGMAAAAAAAKAQRKAPLEVSHKMAAPARKDKPLPKTPLGQAWLPIIEAEIQQLKDTNSIACYALEQVRNYINVKPQTTKEKLIEVVKRAHSEGENGFQGAYAKYKGKSEDILKAMEKGYMPQEAKVAPPRPARKM